MILIHSCCLHQLSWISYGFVEIMWSMDISLIWCSDPWFFLSGCSYMSWLIWKISFCLGRKVFSSDPYVGESRVLLLAISQAVLEYRLTRFFQSFLTRIALHTPNWNHTILLKLAGSCIWSLYIYMVYLQSPSQCQLACA